MFPALCFSASHSIAYSADVKVVAVAYHDYSNTTSAISVFYLLSKTYACPYHAPEGHTVVSVWCHHGRLRFATIEPGSITLWTPRLPRWTHLQRSNHRLFRITLIFHLIPCSTPYSPGLPARLERQFWCGALGNPSSSSMFGAVITGRRPLERPSLLMVVSLCAGLPINKLIYGGSLTQAIYPTERSHPPPTRSPYRFSPPTEDRSSHSVARQLNWGPRRFRPLPPPPLPLDLKGRRASFCNSPQMNRWQPLHGYGTVRPWLSMRGPANHG